METMPITLLTDLNDSHSQCTIMVRVVRVYETLYRSGDSKFMEWVFHDREGTRIHGYVRKDLIGDYRHRFIEGHLYHVTNLVVEKNDLYYLTTTHVHKIRLSRSTVVTNASDNSFPHFMYNFRTFGSLTPDRIDEKHLIDVIGKVVHIVGPQNSERNGVLTKCADLILQDLHNERLDCRLWAQEVDNLMAYYQQHQGEPIVILMKMAKCYYFAGRVTVSNTFWITQVILDAENEEIKDFRTRLLLREGAAAASSQIEVSEAATVEQHDKYQLKKIHELRSCEVGKYYVYTAIQAIDWYLDWSFVACVKCKRKCSQEDTNKFHCNTCNINNCNTIRRYRLEAQIGDGVRNETAIIWDEEAFELLGVSANDLRKKATEGDRLKDPTLFTPLLKREELFLISVRGFEQKYFTVSKLISEPSKKASILKAKATDSQDSNMFSRNVGSEFEEEKGDSDNDEVTTPVKIKGDIKDSAEMSDKKGKTKRVLDDDMSVTGPKRKHRSVLKMKD